MSLFKPTAEVPQFVFEFKYWEGEATTILMAYDVREIQRVIRYRPFCDPNLPASILQTRDERIVERFLLALATPREAAFVAQLSQNEKVNEIIRRSRASATFVPWDWIPSLQCSELDSQAIATEINARSHHQFGRIPFEEWVRYSLGFRVIAVEWFLQQHTNLYNHLLNYLTASRDEIEKYVEVEKVCFTKVFTKIFKQANSLSYSFFKARARSLIEL
ncbi:hypothetical protein PHISP_03920 [Aspergillus sp. HF37]|nr:hypothetical protein PHISP_03920 [Aspergillus sp. HF37]